MVCRDKASGRGGSIGVPAAGGVEDGRTVQVKLVWHPAWRLGRDGEGWRSSALVGANRKKR